jgi:heat shock protein HslJ
MACPVGMDLEQGLLQALEATERFRVLGRQLDLYDADGGQLAQFKAGTAN